MRPNIDLEVFFVLLAIGAWITGAGFLLWAWPT